MKVEVVGQRWFGAKKGTYFPPYLGHKSVFDQREKANADHLFWLEHPMGSLALDPRRLESSVFTPTHILVTEKMKKLRT